MNTTRLFALMLAAMLFSPPMSLQSAASDGEAAPAQALQASEGKPVDKPRPADDDSADDGDEDADVDSAADGQIEIGKVKEVFVPSEEINADSAISFPADI